MTTLTDTIDVLAPALDHAAATADAADRPPHAVVATLARAGVLAAPVATEHGGAGLAPAELNALIERIAYRFPALAIVVFQHFAVATLIARWAGEEQRAPLP